MACSVPQRWIDESISDPLPAGAKIASAGVVRAKMTDSIFDQDEKSKELKVDYDLRNINQSLLDEVNASLTGNSFRNAQLIDSVPKDCFDYQNLYETPKDNKGQELPKVPSLKENCRQSLSEKGVQYVLAAPMFFGHNQIISVLTCTQYGCWDSGARILGPEFSTQINLYELQKGEPIMNAVLTRYISPKDSLDTQTSIYARDLLGLLPLKSGKSKEARKKIMSQYQGLELRAGVSVNPVTNGEFMDIWSETAKRNFITIEGQGSLRYMSPSFWGLEYGYGYGVTSYSKGDGIDYLVQKNHRLVAYAFPAYQRGIRAGFGLGLNYTNIKFATDFIDLVDEGYDSGNPEYDWSDGSGLGFLAKTQLDFMLGYYRMSMALGYDYRTAKVMGWDGSIGTVILEFQVLGLFIPLS